MARRRRIDDMMTEIPEGPTSVFGPGEDNIVPGEVIVTLQADSMAEMAVSLPKVPLRGGVAAVGTTAFGVSALDKVLTKLDVESVTQLHGPSPTNVVNGLVMASDVGLDGTMRVRYRGGDDPQAVVESLNALDEVVWAEPSRWREASITPNDPRFASQWGLTRIGCPAAWDVTTGDPSIVVAIVDTGVDLNHPELAPLTVAGQDLVDFPPGSIPRPGWVFEGDFTGVDGIPQDEVGHGTHVAGTVASLSNNGVGVAGVAWNVRLMPVKVLARIRQTATNRVTGAGSSANIAAGIRWAADNGARVINLSLGGYTETRVEREAIAYAISQGVVVVAAMGNDDTNDPSFPAAFPNVIAVGATTSSDSRASFSNFGPHIDIAAPGVGIQSTYWDDTYASLNGTSMASPHVAGVAALVLSRNSTLTAAQVGNILRTTALALRDNPADPVPNDNYGHGLVQAAAAVNAASPVMPRSLRCPPRSLVMTTCQSQTVRCQPSIIAGSCPTRTIRCQPSVLTVCPTQTVICQPSLLTVCPTRTIRCQPSVLTVCPTQTIRCQPSVAVICPTEAVICQVSNGPGCNPVSLADCPSFPCPNSLGCGGGGRFGEEFDDAEQWDEYDPYGYDPYGTQY